MDTNNIIIIVLWVVIALFTILGIVAYGYDKTKIAWTFLILILILFLVNTGYSIYITHTDYKHKYLASSMFSVIFTACIIGSLLSYFGEEKVVFKPVVKLEGNTPGEGESAPGESQA